MIILKEHIIAVIKSALGPASPYPIPPGLEIEVFGNEHAATEEFTTNIPLVLGRTVHQSTTDIANYLASALNAAGFTATISGAGFVNIQ